MSIFCFTFVKHNHMTGGTTVSGRRALSFFALWPAEQRGAAPDGSKVVLPPLLPLPCQRHPRTPTLLQAFPYKKEPPPPPIRAATPATPRGRPPSRYARRHRPHSSAGVASRLYPPARAALDTAEDKLKEGLRRTERTVERTVERIADDITAI